MRFTMKTDATAMALGLLGASGAHRLFRRRFGGVGSILMFHRTLPDPSPGTASARFQPNRFLTVTPEFFAGVIDLLKRDGVAIVGKSELCDRMLRGDFTERYACLTFDDGYRDNFDHAFRVCRAAGVPMVVYLSVGILDRESWMWWIALEEMIGGRASVHSSTSTVWDTSTPERKQDAYATLSDALRVAPPDEQRRQLERLSEVNAFDLIGAAEAHAMTWDMVREMQASGLVEFGAHSLHHRPLGALSDDEARREIEDSRRRLEERLGAPVRHMSYPFGQPGEAGPREFALCREAGYMSADTTIHGNLHPRHAHQLHALPRLSINGRYQALANVEVFLSGASEALNRLRGTAKA